MNSSAYYLAYVLEFHIHNILDLQKDVQKEKRSGKSTDCEFEQGILAGYYMGVGKLFDTVASLGIFEALPKNLQKDITPTSLVEDLKKGVIKPMLQLRSAFRATCPKVSYGTLNLKVLLEELIADAQLLRASAQSEFDQGKLTAYYRIVDWLYDQAEFFVPELFDALPKELRDFNTESINQ